ncbi:hypothetical protein SAMN05443144_104185 [Fodinibius roseus]|uniref:Uncharacterized protein n=1 Tax=Fodinibius roseus TaxID=1194090 RepID=A0A1M4XPV0_9BACT|nr:hypothetical protein SAMN05443144_104185 [Fodinibius roseus]
MTAGGPGGRVGALLDYRLVGVAEDTDRTKGIFYAP